MATLETDEAHEQRSTRTILKRYLASTGHFVAFGVPDHQSMPAIRTILAGEDTWFPGLVTSVSDDATFKPVSPFLVAALAVAAFDRFELAQMFKNAVLLLPSEMFNRSWDALPLRGPAALIRTSGVSGTPIYPLQSVDISR